MAVSSRRSSSTVIVHPRQAVTAARTPQPDAKCHRSSLMMFASLGQHFAVDTIAAARSVQTAIAFELAAETQEVGMDKAYIEDEPMRLPSVAAGASAEACCSEETSEARRKAGALGGAPDRRRWQTAMQGHSWALSKAARLSLIAIVFMGRGFIRDGPTRRTGRLQHFEHVARAIDAVSFCRANRRDDARGL